MQYFRTDQIYLTERARAAMMKIWFMHGETKNNNNKCERKLIRERAEENVLSHVRFSIEEKSRRSQSRARVLLSINNTKSA